MDTQDVNELYPHVAPMHKTEDLGLIFYCLSFLVICSSSVLVLGLSKVIGGLTHPHPCTLMHSFSGPQHPNVAQHLLGAVNPHQHIVISVAVIYTGVHLGAIHSVGLDILILTCVHGNPVKQSLCSVF